MELVACKPRIAHHVFEQAKRAGQPIRLLALPREIETNGNESPNTQASSQTTLEPTQVGSVDGIKKALAGFDGWSLLQGGSLMSSPETLRAAAACDGTVLVLKQKADSRSNVERISREIREAGGTVLGTVLRG